MKRKSIDRGQAVSGKHDPCAGLPPVAAKLMRMAIRAGEAEVFARALVEAASKLKAECETAAAEYTDDPVRNACKKARVKQYVSDEFFLETLDAVHQALLKLERAAIKADNVVRGWEVEPVFDAPDSPRFKKIKNKFCKKDG